MMEEIRLATDGMRSTAEEILSQVDAMPQELIHWKPGPEIWTVMDNLCHIAEFVPYWTVQIEQVVSQPEKEWGRTHHDADRLAAVADTSKRDLAEVKQQIRSRVAESAARLEKLSAEQLATEAPSCNPRWGVKPASFIVETLLVKHLQSHLGQIRRNLSQYPQQS